MEIKVPNIPFRVITVCMTYNHSMYIEDALNGFVMQDTTFPYVCVIIDDASLDREQDVIREFIERECVVVAENCYETDDAHVIVAQPETNINCTFAVYLLKENHYSCKRSKMPYIYPWIDNCKYVAICEGDDYWIDSFKLQKQYDILENNNDVTMCVSDAKVLSSNAELNWTRYSFDCLVPIKDIIEHGGMWLQTASFFYRIEIVKTMPECGTKCHVGDYPLIIWMGLNGKVYYIAKKTVVYRYGYGWTSSFQNQPIEQRLAGWHSEVNMLQGFNEISKRRYNAFFQNRLNFYILDIFVRNKSERQRIYCEFNNIIRYLPVKKQIKLQLYRFGLDMMIKDIETVCSKIRMLFNW